MLLIRARGVVAALSLLVFAAGCSAVLGIGDIPAQDEGTDGGPEGSTGGPDSAGPGQGADGSQDGPSSLDGNPDHVTAASDASDARAVDGGADGAAPDGHALDGSAPDGDAHVQDSSAPEAAQDSNVPDTYVQDVNVPDTSVQDTSTPDAADAYVHDTSTPDTSVVDAADATPACPPATPTYCPQSATCVDTTNDPSNCGNCGVPCSGLCTASTCYPGISVVTPTPAGMGAYDLATDGVNVYWTGGNGNIYQCAVGGCGGNPMVLAQGQNAPQSIVTDGVNVYWGNGAASNQGVIYSVPVGGTTITTIATGGQPGWLAVGGGFGGIVFWTDLATSSLRGCPTAGCATPSSPTIVAPSLSGPVGIATDSMNVYVTSFASNGGIYSCPISLNSCSPSPVATGQASPEFVATDGTYVYWPTRSGNMGGLWKQAAVSGGTGPTSLYTGTGAFYGLASDGVNVYAMGAGVVACSVNGCGTTLTIVGPVAGTAGGYRPVLDSSHVYWAAPQGILRAAKL